MQAAKRNRIHTKAVAALVALSCSVGLQLTGAGAAESFERTLKFGYTNSPFCSNHPGCIPFTGPAVPDPRGGVLTGNCSYNDTNKAIHDNNPYSNLVNVSQYTKDRARRVRFTLLDTEGIGERHRLIGPLFNGTCTVVGGVGGELGVGDSKDSTMPKGSKWLLVYGWDVRSVSWIIHNDKWRVTFLD